MTPIVSASFFLGALSVTINGNVCYNLLVPVVSAAVASSMHSCGDCGIGVILSLSARSVPIVIIYWSGMISYRYLAG